MSNKEIFYSLYYSKNDNIYRMRWKLAYFFDLYVNDVVIYDINNKKYNLLYDDNKFHDLFPQRKYHKNNLQFEFKYEETNIRIIILGYPFYLNCLIIILELSALFVQQFYSKYQNH